MAEQDEITVRDGTTDYIVFVVENNGTAINLSAVNHVRLDMIDSRHKVYRYASNDDSPIFYITDAANGEVELRPTSDIFKAGRSPYKVYVWVYSTASKRYSCPEKGEAIIKIRREF